MENVIRSQLLHYKLQDRIAMSVKVTNPEIRTRYVDDNEKVKVKYIFAASSAFPDSLVPVSDTEIQTYYGAHQDEFKRPAQIRCEYVSWPKEPTREDEEATEQEIRELLEEIKGGADFAALAEEYSDDPGSAANGGDLGIFGRGHMVKPFEETAFALKVGEVSQPVKTQFGWHLIKVEERKEEEGAEKVRARHILLKIEPDQSRIEKMRRQAELFSEEAKEEGFDQIAIRDSMNTKDTDFFVRGNFIPGIGVQVTSAVNTLFESEIGTILRPYENDRGIHIFHLLDKRDAGVIPLSEARERVSRELMKDKKAGLAAEKLRTVRVVSNGVRLEKMAQEANLTVEESEPFSRSGYVPGIGSRNEFFGAAFKLAPDEISDVVKTDRGAYLIQMVEKTPIDEDDFQKRQEEMKQKLHQEKRNQAITAWFSHLQEQAQIKDNRHLFYDF